MAAVSIGASHVVAGELRDGEKVVFSTFVTDDGGGATTVVRVNPLTKIFAYTWGVTENNCSGSTIKFSVTPGGTMSGKTTTSGNLLNIINSGASESGMCTIKVMSIGV